MKVLVYGAYGYTGSLIIRMVESYGLVPILAGRNASKLESFAKDYPYESKSFSLEETDKLHAALEEVDLLLHCAGPFMYTAKPMMEACIEKGVHYLDITGEIDVFELAHDMDAKAKAANIMVMSGVGFDVVPTDCMAAYLKNKLPDATHLQLAFANLGGAISHGTSLTMVENLGKPGSMRKDGKIIAVPLGHDGMTVPFIPKDIYCMAIPWGDVSTAFYTTGIPNIETFTRVRPQTHKMVKRMRPFNWIMRSSLVKTIAKRQVEKRPAGPNDEMRAKASSHVWGKVRNAKGEEVKARLQVPEGYTLTAITALMISKKVLEGNWKAGHQTPAGMYGQDLIMEVEGVIREDLP
ncbi:MAG: saccharopine dehydrogenase NADP-binding domain-containing protein [Bacteroidia bacterium]|nr:saccharopine dehydrogenase NADP-binding domain-containing protein [Bacteroidia bacterium]